MLGDGPPESPGIRGGTEVLMPTCLDKTKYLARLTAWLLMACLIGTLPAPALRAAGSAKPDLVGGDEVTIQGTETSDDAGVEFDEDDDDEARASDSLFDRTPRSDRTQLNRTLGTIVGAVGLGLLGLSFGPFGFFIGAALGAGIGYVISREVFQDYRPRYQGSQFTDPYYDSYYGPGSRWSPLPSANNAGTGFTADEGTSLHDAQQAYFEALDEYRESLREGELDLMAATRQRYLDAYQALLRARATAR